MHDVQNTCPLKSIQPFYEKGQYEPIDTVLISAVKMQAYSSLLIATQPKLEQPKK